MSFVCAPECACVLMLFVCVLCFVVFCVASLVLCVVWECCTGNICSALLLFGAGGLERKDDSRADHTESSSLTQKLDNENMQRKPTKE